MKELRLALLLALSVTLATSVGARPPLPEAGMAKKRTVTPEVAGYAKQHGPHSQIECIAVSGGREHEPRLRRPVPQ